jgi:hypothetical protein
LIARLCCCFGAYFAQQVNISSSGSVVYEFYFGLCSLSSSNPVFDSGAHLGYLNWSFERRYIYFSLLPDDYARLLASNVHGLIQRSFTTPYDFSDSFVASFLTTDTFHRIIKE